MIKIISVISGVNIDLYSKGNEHRRIIKGERYFIVINLFIVTT